MLVRDDGLCIGQASHAWLSGQLARAWAAPLNRREEVLLACAQHDIGMSEWDRTPTLDGESGFPTPFTRMPTPLRIALWEAAPLKVVTQSAYAALLVSLHGTRLYERFPPPPGHEALVASYMEGQHALQAALSAATGADAEDVAAARALIELWDAMSLALCLEWDQVPGLDPWPFDRDVVEVECEGRRLTPCASEAELHAALASANVEPVRFTLRR